VAVDEPLEAPLVDVSLPAVPVASPLGAGALLGGTVVIGTAVVVVSAVAVAVVGLVVEMGAYEVPGAG
jgi:hypothetical protein